jgi:hypothetical protein
VYFATQASSKRHRSAECADAPLVIWQVSTAPQSMAASPLKRSMVRLYALLAASTATINILLRVEFVSVKMALLLLLTTKPASAFAAMAL